MNPETYIDYTPEQVQEIRTRYSELRDDAERDSDRISGRELVHAGALARLVGEVVQKEAREIIEQCTPPMSGSRERDSAVAQYVLAIEARVARRSTRSIEPCPWCHLGGDEISMRRSAFDSWKVVSSCGASGPYMRSKYEAVDRWNEGASAVKEARRP